MAAPVEVVVGAVLPDKLPEASGEIRVEDTFDIPLDSGVELLVAFGTDVEGSGVGDKTAGLITTDAVKNETRVAAEELGGLVFFGPFELRKSDKDIFSLACVRFAFAVETAGMLATFALTGSVERYKAHKAEKRPEVPKTGFAPPTEPRVEAGATFGFADWMAVVTGKFRVDGNSELSRHGCI